MITIGTPRESDIAHLVSAWVKGTKNRDKNPRIRKLITAEAVDVFGQVVEIEIRLPGSLVR